MSLALDTIAAMIDWVRRIKSSRLGRERSLAAAVVVTAGILFLTGSWVFGAALRPRRGDSLWQALLSDRLTLGVVRMLTTVLALYVLASIAILVLRGRWMRAISTSGLEAEAASDVENTIASLERRVEGLQRDREEFLRMLWRSDRG